MNFLHLLSASREGAKAAIPASTHLSLLMMLIVEPERHSKKLVRIFLNAILEKTFWSFEVLKRKKEKKRYSTFANMYSLGINMYL